LPRPTTGRDHESNKREGIEQKGKAQIAFRRSIVDRFYFSVAHLLSGTLARIH
jgi:hypothetical protein